MPFDKETGLFRYLLYQRAVSGLRDRLLQSTDNPTEFITSGLNLRTEVQEKLLSLSASEFAAQIRSHLPSQFSDETVLDAQARNVANLIIWWHRYHPDDQEKINFLESFSGLHPGPPEPNTLNPEQQLLISASISKVYDFHDLYLFLYGKIVPPDKLPDNRQLSGLMSLIRAMNQMPVNLNFISAYEITNFNKPLAAALEEISSWQECNQADFAALGRFAVRLTPPGMEDNLSARLRIIALAGNNPESDRALSSLRHTLIINQSSFESSLSDALTDIPLTGDTRVIWAKIYQEIYQSEALTPGNDLAVMFKNRILEVSLNHSGQQVDFRSLGALLALFYRKLILTPEYPGWKLISYEEAEQIFNFLLSRFLSQPDRREKWWHSSFYLNIPLELLNLYRELAVNNSSPSGPLDRLSRFDRIGVFNSFEDYSDAYVIDDLCREAGLPARAVVEAAVMNFISLAPDDSPGYLQAIRNLALRFPVVPSTLFQIIDAVLPKPLEYNLKRKIIAGFKQKFPEFSAITATADKAEVGRFLEENTLRRYLAAKFPEVLPPRDILLRLGETFNVRNIGLTDTTVFANENRRIVLVDCQYLDRNGEIIGSPLSKRQKLDIIGQIPDKPSDLTHDPQNVPPFALRESEPAKENWLILSPQLIKVLATINGNPQDYPYGGWLITPSGNAEIKTDIGSLKTPYSVINTASLLEEIAYLKSQGWQIIGT